MTGLGGVLVLPANAYKRNRGPWLKARRAGLGASDTAAILGVHDRRTALDVWLSKTATGEPEDVQTEPMEAGHRLEDVVARWTVDRHPALGKLVPTPGLLAHPDHPWMLATLDRGLADRGSRDNPIRAILEVKTTSFRTYAREWLDGVPPRAVQVQVQQQMAVTGMDECWVTVGVGGDNGPLSLKTPYRVPRSPEVIEQIIHYAGAWWRDHVIDGVRPEPEFRDADKLAGLYPADDSLDAVVMDEALETDLAQYLDTKRRADALAKQAEELKFRLQKAMGNATALAWPDKRVAATNKEQTKRSLDKKALAAERPDVLAVIDEYTRPGQPFRVFKVKEDAQ